MNIFKMYGNKLFLIGNYDHAFSTFHNKKSREKEVFQVPL